MKYTRLLPLLFIACGVARYASADVSPISISVQQISEDKRDKKVNLHQKKSLKITLSNSSSQEASLNVKYFYFGKDAKSHLVTALSTGEKAAIVEAHGKAEIETASATATFVDRHADGNPPKEVAASGIRMVGYGVQVTQNGKPAAEYFSEPGLAKVVTGAK